MHRIFLSPRTFSAVVAVAARAWFVLSALALVALPFRALGADIRWRGTTSDDFHSAANWDLPPDVPPGLTPAQAEAFRRAPGPQDRAIAGSGSKIRISRAASLSGAQLGGELEVQGRNTLVVVDSSATPSGPTGVGDDFGVVRVLDGGQLHLRNATTVNGEVTIRAGHLILSGRATVRSAVRLEGVKNSELKSLLGARLPDAALLVLDAGLTLDGDVDSFVELDGRLEIRDRNLRWRNCHVQQSPGGNPGQLGRVDLDGVNLEIVGGGDRPMIWTGSPQVQLQFRADAGLRLGPAEIFFSTPVTFFEGSLGIRKTSASDQIVRFVGAGVKMVGSRNSGESAFRVDGPVSFESTQEIAILPGSGASASTDPIPLGGEDFGENAFRVVSFSGLTKTEIQTPVRWSNVRILDRASITVDATASAGKFGRLVLGSGGNGVGTPTGRCVMESGALKLTPAGGKLEIPSGYEWQFGVEDSDETELQTPVVNALMANRGLVRIIGGKTRDRLTHVNIVGEFQNFGLLTSDAGSGFTRESIVWNGPSGQIRLEPKPDLQPDIFPSSSLGGVFINEGAVRVASGSGAECIEGVALALSSLEVESGGVLSIVGRGARDEFKLSDGRTFRLLKMFCVRSNATVTFADGSRVELAGEGRYGRNFPKGAFTDERGGLHLEKPVSVDTLLLGVQDGQMPRIEFGEGQYPDGVGLRVRKLLRWFGGAFVGNGSENRASTAGVELAATAEAFLQTPPAPNATGDNHAIGGGLTFTVRGRMTVDTLRAVTSEDSASRYVFEKDSTVAILAARSQADLTTARVINRTIARKEGPQPFFFNGHWINEEGGQLQSNGGEVLFRLATLTGSNFKTAETGVSVRTDEATLKNFNHEGGAFTVFRKTHFSGACQFDSLTIGNALSSETSVTSDPDTTIGVKNFFTWRNNSIDLELGSRIVLEPGSKSRLQSVAPISPAGILRHGVIVNRGELTYAPDDKSPLLFQSGGALENEGTLILDASKGRIFFPFNALGDPSGFSCINRGLVLLSLIEQGRINVKFAALFAMLDNPGSKLKVEALLNPGGQGQQERRAALAAPLPPQIQWQEFNMSAGECEVEGVEMQFAKTVNFTAGRFIADNADLIFGTVFNFNGGELRLEGQTRCQFTRVTNVRKGRLLIDAEAVLEAVPGFNLRDGSLLSGLGRTTGGVAVLDSTVSPGMPDRAENGNERRGALTIGTDISFDANSILILDVPVNTGDGNPDVLNVNGRAKLNGTLVLRPKFAELREINTSPIRVLDYNVREGEFAGVQSGIIPPDARLTNEYLDPKASEMVVAVVVDTTSADLQLAVTGPVIQSTDATLVYKWTVHNRGPASAPKPRFEATLPTVGSFVSSTPAGTIQGDRLIVTLPTLAANGSSEIELQWRAPSTQSAVLFQGLVSSDLNDSLAANNRAQISTAVYPNGVFSIGKFSIQASGLLNLVLETLTGIRYRLETSADFVRWTVVEEFVGDGGNRDFKGLGIPGGAPEFFRVVIVP